MNTITTIITKGVIEHVKNGMTVTRRGHYKTYNPEYIIKRKKHKLIGDNEVHHFFLGHKNGTIYHSIDGPAIIDYLAFHNTTLVYYYINGFKIRDTRDFCYLSGMDEMDTVAYILKYGDTLPVSLDGDPYDVTAH